MSDGEMLVSLRVQWDSEVGVGRHEGRLTAVRDRFADPEGEPLDEAIVVLHPSPLVVGGALPSGVVRVSGSRWDVRVGEGAWLAVTHCDAPIAALEDLRYVRQDGAMTAVPSLSDVALNDIAHLYPDELGDRIPPPAELDDAGRAYGRALAEAIARDLVAHPVPGEVVRAVIRWFWDGDPRYLTMHVLGSGDVQPPDEDAWYPLEWANARREMERTDRVGVDERFTVAADALAATFAMDDAGMAEDGEAHVPGVIEAVLLLGAALDAAGVDRSTGFAATASHFEGWGGAEVLEETCPPELLAELRDRGLFPEE